MQIKTTEGANIVLNPQGTAMVKVLSGLSATGITDTGGIASTTAAPVTSITTNATTGAAGYLLPVNTVAGVWAGQIASGTNIPAGDAVQVATGGTAPVTLTVPQSVAVGASYIPVSSTTGVLPGMFLTDTTTPGAFPANTLVAGVTGGAASAPAALIGTAGASGTQAITVSANGTRCTVGMLLFDTTAAVVPLNAIVMMSSATSVVISQSITGAGIGASDNIQCYPGLYVNQLAAATVNAADSLKLSPVIQLQAFTTGSVPSGTVVSLGALASTVGAGITSTGPISNGVAGAQQKGWHPFFRRMVTQSNNFSARSRH